MVGGRFMDLHGKESPVWLVAGQDVAPFDVRPLIAAGTDPFSELMAKAESVASGEVLVVDAPFNPSPLRRALAARGFSSWGRQLAEGHWRIHFRRDGANGWQDGAEFQATPEDAAVWREADGLHIDVRRLDAPRPMLAILRLIDGLGPAERVVTVHHERMPHFLLPELAERNWRLAHCVESTFDLRLRLEREG